MLFPIFHCTPESAFSVATKLCTSAIRSNLDLFSRQNDPVFTSLCASCDSMVLSGFAGHTSLLTENSTRHSYKQPAPVLSWHSGVPSSLRYSSISTLKHFTLDFLKCFLEKDPRLPNTHLPHLQLRAKDVFRSFGSRPSSCSVIPLLVQKPHRAHSTARTSLKLQHSAHNTETWKQSNLCTKIAAGPEDAASPSAAPAFCSSAQILGNSRMTPQYCDNC